MGRAIMPELYAANATDTAVIKLPMALSSRLLGQILSGITSAGAFAAFMSTFSGLLVSMSGAFAHDIYGKMINPNASPENRLRAFKLAAIGVGVVSMLLGLMVETFDIATMVGWAFAIGAASYFPLLLLGSWWRGLTRQGAATGMLLGGLASLLAIVCSMLLDKKILTWDVSPIVRSLMEQPAIWGVPLSLATMYVVSMVTQKGVPTDIGLKMLRLHAPEESGLSKDYIEA
jgi:Na+(H+)/acetate symporter ActP